MIVCAFAMIARAARGAAENSLAQVRDKLVPFRPDYVFTGHGPRQHGTAFIEDLLERTEKALGE